MYGEDELVPISALQHAVFCERQFALIHIERMWEENVYTAEGRILHERVDMTHRESRGISRVEYGMPVRSMKYGLIGKADLVEFQLGRPGSYLRIQPVEFKRGKRKVGHEDRVQLCAQALCLEEMFGTRINDGQFYYLQEHRRTTVEFSTDLRSLTHHVTNRVRELMEEGRTPAAVYDRRKCDRCSLYDRCMPRALAGGGKGVARYVIGQIRRTLREDG